MKYNIEKINLIGKILLPIDMSDELKKTGESAPFFVAVSQDG